MSTNGTRPASFRANSTAKPLPSDCCSWATGAEEFGGVPTDPFYRIIVSEELAKAGSGGVNASLMSHSIGAPPIAALGPDWMKRKVLPEILAGEKISALAITEPSGGSDVANLKTTARREGDHYVVNGQKMFITSGFRADYYTVAVRTGGPGASGVSLLLIERDRPGFSRTKLRKMGWWASDTASATGQASRAPSCARWAGGRRTRRSSSSTTSRCLSRI